MYLGDPLYLQHTLGVNGAPYVLIPSSSTSKPKHHHSSVYSKLYSKLPWQWRRRIVEKRLLCKQNFFPPPPPSPAAAKSKHVLVWRPLRLWLWQWRGLHTIRAAATAAAARTPVDGIGFSRAPRQFGKSYVAAAAFSLSPIYWPMGEVEH